MPEAIQALSSVVGIVAIITSSVTVIFNQRHTRRLEEMRIKAEEDRVWNAEIWLRGFNAFEILFEKLAETEMLTRKLTSPFSDPTKVGEPAAKAADDFQLASRTHAIWLPTELAERFIKLSVDLSNAINEVFMADASPSTSIRLWSDAQKKMDGDIRDARIELEALIRTHLSFRPEA